VDALAAGTASPTVTEAIGQRERRLAEVRASLAATRTAPAVQGLDVKALQREARSRFADLRGMLRRTPDEARKALEAVFGGPLRFHAVDAGGGRRYLIEGTATAALPDSLVFASTLGRNDPGLLGKMGPGLNWRA